MSNGRKCDSEEVCWRRGEYQNKVFTLIRIVIYGNKRPNECMHSDLQLIPQVIVSNVAVSFIEDSSEKRNR